MGNKVMVGMVEMKGLMQIKVHMVVLEVMLGLSQMVMHLLLEEIFKAMVEDTWVGATVMPTGMKAMYKDGGSDPSQTFGNYGA